MRQQGAERPGHVLRKAIDFQLRAYNAFRPPVSIRELPRDRIARGVILVGAGDQVTSLGFERGDERLKRVGGAVTNRGWKEIAVGKRTP